MQGLSLVAASRGHSSSRCAGLSLSRPLLLQSTGSRHAGSVIVAHGPSRSTACGIFPDQGTNPRPLHWQADSQPLRHQGSLSILFILFSLFCCAVVISTVLSSRSLIRSSASVFLLFFHSRVILISFIVLFIIVCLLFSSCRSLLNVSFIFSFYFQDFGSSLLSLL